MDVQVRHRFPSIRPVVNGETKAAVVHPELTGDFARSEEQLSEQGSVLFFRHAHARDHLLRDDQDVRRRFGIDVAERKQIVVLVDDIGREFRGV